jgi:hypothetical protein
LGVVKGTRRAWKAVGTPLDAEDRKLFGSVLIWIVGGGVAVVTVAGIAGLSWRLFWLAAG